MKNFIYVIIAILFLSCTTKEKDETVRTPKIENGEALSLVELANAREVEIGSAFYYRPGFDHVLYEKEFLNNFNLLTPEDGIIFRLIKPSQDEWIFDVPDKIVGFAHENGLKVRGQHLIWHHYHDGGYLLPKWLLEGDFSEDELKEIMKEFIQKTMIHYKEKFPGTVKWWSVVNEIVSNAYPGQYMDSFWYRELGEEYIDYAFYCAKEADPDAKLYYNDYYIEGLSEMTYKADFAYKVVKGLVKREVPIDGVGLQCHFTLDNYPGKNSMGRVIKRFIDLGLEVYITELDIKIENGVTEEKLEKQADIYKEIMELVIDNQPGATITTWGFNDSQTYVGEEYSPTLTDGDYNPKPSMNALRDTLIYY